jgi:hypothetical protein
LTTESNTHSFLVHEVKSAINAPWDALRFFRKHKTLLFAALSGHIVLFVLYMIAISQWVLPLLLEAGKTKDPAFFTTLQSLGFLWTLVSHLLLASFYVLATLLYSVLAVPIANLLLSPLFDVLATKSYQWVSGVELPQLGLTAFFKSFWLELLKLLFLGAIFFGTLLSVWLVLIAPLVFLFAIWFYGWQEVDRTLGLAGLPWKKRLWFGIRHFPACMCFGIWFYIPLAGTLLAFVMTAAAGILVAHVQSPAEKEEMNLLAQQKLGTQIAALQVDDDRR